MFKSLEEENLNHFSQPYICDIQIGTNQMNENSTALKIIIITCIYLYIYKSNSLLKTLLEMYLINFPLQLFSSIEDLSNAINTKLKH